MLGLVVLGQTPKSAQVLKAILSPSHNRPLDGYCAVPSLLAKIFLVWQLPSTDWPRPDLFRPLSGLTSSGHSLRLAASGD